MIYRTKVANVMKDKRFSAARSSKCLFAHAKTVSEKNKQRYT